jgi:hypothetical protein
MVLRWALTRDQAAVLVMVDIYGAVGVFEDHEVCRLAAEDIEAVTIAYCTDLTLPLGEERAAAAVVLSQRVIAAKAGIYRALRNGELEAYARRNGSGDVEKIRPSQWLSLKFQSWNGHDLAVPINVEKDILNLPQPLEDYIDGRVPAEVFPAVWPDPHFIANQVLQIWAPHEPKQVAAAAEVSTGSSEIEPSDRRHGLSDREWKIYEEALRLKPDFSKKWGGISQVARLIAKGSLKINVGTARRTLTRVLQKLRA